MATKKQTPKTPRFSRPTKETILLATRFLKENVRDLAKNTVEIYLRFQFKKQLGKDLIAAGIETVVVTKEVVYPNAEGWPVPDHAGGMKRSIESISEEVSQLIMAEKTKHRGQRFDRGTYCKTDKKLIGQKPLKVFIVKFQLKTEEDESINKTVVIFDENCNPLPTWYAAIFSPGWDPNSTTSIALNKSRSKDNMNKIIVRPIELC